jgi:hypothetical protein
MDSLSVPATKFTPEIFLSEKKNLLQFTGESYPENTAEFYRPVFKWINEYLKILTSQPVTVNIEISYFNSSSSKVLMDIFDNFEEVAEQGKNITINWFYRGGDDATYEYGEEFKEDLASVSFNLIQKNEKSPN